MIELKCVFSPDQDLLGSHLFFLDSVSIGAKKDHIFLANDPLADASMAKLYIENDKIFLKPSEQHFCLINGKRHKIRMPLQVGDSFQIASSIFELVRFNPEKMTHIKEVFHEHLNNITDNNLKDYLSKIINS